MDGMNENLDQKKADFNVSRNDLHWEYYDRKDGRIHWFGYNDAYWWDNVAPSDQFRKKIGEVTDKEYTLDPHSHTVTISEEPWPRVRVD